MIANNRKVGLHCCITCSKLLFKCFKWRCEKKNKHESIRKCMNIKVTKYYVTGGTCTVQPSREKWLCIRSEGRKLALLLWSLSLYCPEYKLLALQSVCYSISTSVFLAILVSLNFAYKHYCT